jgi:hypothetical protein
MIEKKVMLMHIGLTEVIKWEIKFSFVSSLIRVPFGSGRGKSCHFNLYDCLKSKRELESLPIVSYFHPTCIKLIMLFMYLFYVIMLLTNLIK